MLLFWFRVSLIIAAVSIVQIAPAGPTDAAQWLGKSALEFGKSHKEPHSNLTWFDAADLTQEGRAFQDTLTSYSRLPVRYKGKVTPGVWSAGRSATGVAIRFVTDSPTISAIWDSPAPAMPHMAWTGSGGVDLYQKINSKWVYRGTGKPTTTSRMMAEVKRFGTTEKTPAEYLLCLPLYSPVKQVEIGIASGSSIAPAPDEYQGKLPIVFYGTSITQGGCASRTGMSHTSILRRWLDYPVINLGFSGSGKCEMIISQLLAEIPASIYVIETLQNMTVDQINERVVPFVKDLRKRRPDTPIVLVESPNQETQADKHVALRKAFDKLQADKVPGVTYHSGEHMYDTIEEPTVDGTHPTDLGFYQMARDYEPFLRDLLKLPKK